MKVLWLILLVVGALATDIVDPKDCKSFPCLIFDEEFDTFDHLIWEHEISAHGGGNGEFEVYVNNRSITYINDSVLFIKPDLTVDWKDEDFLTEGELNLYSINGRNDDCTSNFNFGCDRYPTDENILSPVRSGKIRTLYDFAFRYGRIEIKAKMPRGDWLWPAVWLLPQYFPYGPWPASGEIDIIESKGNDDFGKEGNEYAMSTLHWGPYIPVDPWNLTHSEYKCKSCRFSDDFHVWRLDWTKDDLKFYLDEGLVMTVDAGDGFYDLGGFDEINAHNPWASGTKLAPFDQRFYIIINLAVGGTGGFFADGVSEDKPWKNDSPSAFTDFWKARDKWLPTWKNGEDVISEDAALQVDYIKVWKMENEDQ